MKILPAKHVYSNPVSNLTLNRIESHNLNPCKKYKYVNEENVAKIKKGDMWMKLSALPGILKKVKWIYINILPEHRKTGAATSVLTRVSCLRHT